MGLAANGVLGNTKNPQKTVQVDSEMHNFGGQYRLPVCFNVVSDAFHKSRKREKGIRPQAINIGRLEMATDESGGGFAAKNCPLSTFFLRGFHETHFQPGNPNLTRKSMNFIIS